MAQFTTVSEPTPPPPPPPLKSRTYPLMGALRVGEQSGRSPLPGKSEIFFSPIWWAFLLLIFIMGGPFSMSGFFCYFFSLYGGFLPHLGGLFLGLRLIQKFSAGTYVSTVIIMLLRIVTMLALRFRCDKHYCWTRDCRTIAYYYLSTIIKQTRNLRNANY